VGSFGSEVVVGDVWHILLWWLMFGGTHVIGSSRPIRTRLIRSIGIWGFKGLYSLVALATFVPLCFVYFSHKHAGPLLFVASSGHRMATHALMLVAIIVVLQSLVTPSPLTTLAEMTGSFRARARGIQHVTRHPQNFGFAIFGFAHALSNPSVGDCLFFGGFVVYGILSAVHQDRRTLATGREEIRQFQSDTSFVPFAAILSGKQRLALAEYNRIALVISVIVFILLRLVHSKLFGGFLS
jgi:uncharacterized membrane protein